MNWKEKEINLNKIKEGSINKIVYTALKPLDIKVIKPSCGNCTTVKGYNHTTKELTVVYRPQTVPVHLQMTLGYQNVRKTIIITYEDGSKDTLSFIAKIIK